MTNVALWHIADMGLCGAHVRFGQERTWQIYEYTA